MNVFILLIILILPLPVFAQDAPVPQSRKQALQSVENELKEKSSELQILEKNVEKKRSELSSTKRQLVDIAAGVRQNEKQLTKLEKNIAALLEEKSDIETRLQADQGSIASLILALERIRRIPPEALMLRPGTPLKTAQSAMLLNTILPQIYERSEKLKKDTSRLTALIDELEADRKSLTSKKVTLEKEYASIETLLDKRKRTFKDINKNHKQRSAEVQQISRRASSLKDLVSKLESDNKRAATRDSVKKAIYRQPAALPKAGQGQLPISGFITVGYGKTDDIGAKSQGIHIEGRSRALVTAPMGGKVQFSGPFKNYGQLIIIEHEKGYHSLVAGMHRIDIVVDQVVRAGEPIGQMPSIEDNGETPTLYYELRRNGKPVNPATKIANIKS